jgi:hypothetical protein
LEQIDQSDSLSLDNVEAISAKIKLLALQCKDRPLEILRILRVLEQLHSDICSEIFQPALPNSRHALFDLLKEIEAEGGWPHIYHRNLNQLFEQVEFFPSDPSLESPDHDPITK